MNEPEYDVAIVGAGFAGLYLLHRCRQLGLNARIWEAGDGVGGTWYWNRYPGARCDIESMQYSYQFDESLQQEWEWSERYASQEEILRYLEHVAERFELLDGIDFNHRVEAATYDEGKNIWMLTTATRKRLTARFCIMATGCLSAPNWPPIPGYEFYNGAIHHTALWPHDGVDLTDKRVAVIGTGSSAIQSIPQIAAVAKHVTVFQRTPNYSVPAHNRPMDPAYSNSVKAEYDEMRARARTRFPGIDGEYSTSSALKASEEERLAEYEHRWQSGGILFMYAFDDLMKDPAANQTAVDFVHGKIRSIVKDQEVAELLCPPNIMGGKRVCVDTDYYDTYNRDNVELVDIREEPISTLNKTGLMIGDTQYDANVIVVATGFDAMTGALNRIDIRGRDDISLREQWQNGPSSYLGLAMADFPNLFTVTGPGSPSVLTNMLPSIEQHVEWITDCLNHVEKAKFTIVEAKRDAEDAWWAHVQEASEVGLKQSTDSWYLGANIEGKARVFMPYLGGFPAYCEKCDDVVANGYEGFSFS